MGKSGDKITYRKGKEVIKTTIEIEASLYKRIQIEIARKHMSLRDFMCAAANEKLTGSLTDAGTVEYNETGRKLRDALAKAGFPNYFPEGIIAAACKEAELSVSDLKPKDMKGPLKEIVLRYVGHIHGEDGRKEMDDYFKEIFK